MSQIKRAPYVFLNNLSIVEFSKVSTFTSEEINDLYLYFTQLSKAKRDDGVIDFEEFCMAVDVRDGPFARNLFAIFDTNDDKVINFREFILAFATFLNETIDKQIKLSFKLYDPRDTGRVSKKTAVALLKDVAQGLPEDLISEMVDETFAEARSKYFNGTVMHPASSSVAPNSEMLQEADDEDFISFEMYEKMAYENDAMVKWLALDLQRVYQAAKLILSDKAAIKNIAA